MLLNQLERYGSDTRALDLANLHEIRSVENHYSSQLPLAKSESLPKLSSIYPIPLGSSKSVDPNYGRLDVE